MKKSVLNEIKKERTFTKVSRTRGKSKGKYLKIRRPSNLADKVNCSEKRWLLYEFPFSLNPGDKPNDAQA